MKIDLEFYECEHEGNLNWYLEGIDPQYATIINSSIDYELEYGFVTIEINEKDKDEFFREFRMTEQSEFIDTIRIH